MRPRPRPGPGRRAADPAAALGAILLGAVLLVAGCASAITADRVTQAVHGTFTRLVLDQQALLGHPGLGADWVSPRVDCRRHSAGAGDRGAGDDWECRVTWRSADGTEHGTVYEVAVRTNGCFTASGPPADVGPQLIGTAGGRRLTNPIYQFDGCFDPS